MEACPRASHRHVTKPVSRVLYRARMGARRWPFISNACRQAPLATNPGGSSGNETGGFEAAAPPLFGLAPGGVCRAAPVARTAVRSYRTLSPLPSEAVRRRAVCFLWHCPWGRPRRRLSGTVLPRSPDFPPCLPIRWLLAERPSGLLTGLIRGFGRLASSRPLDQEGQALNAVSAMARSSLRLEPGSASWRSALSTRA